MKARCTTYRSPGVFVPTAPKDPTCETINEDPSHHTESIIGKDEFLGLTVVKRMTRFNDGNTYESWQAPDLGCKEISTRVTKKDPDPDELYYPETAATKIEFGEPNPALFEIPADYEENPPSQIRIKRFAKNGWEISEGLMESFRFRDEQYWSSQVYKPVK